MKNVWKIDFEKNVKYSRRLEISIIIGTEERKEERNNSCIQRRVNVHFKVENTFVIWFSLAVSGDKNRIRWCQIMEILHWLTACLILFFICCRSSKITKKSRKRDEIWCFRQLIVRAIKQHKNPKIEFFGKISIFWHGGGLKQFLIFLEQMHFVGRRFSLSV